MLTPVVEGDIELPFVCEQNLLDGSVCHAAFPTRETCTKSQKLCRIRLGLWCGAILPSRVCLRTHLCATRHLRTWLHTFAHSFHMVIWFRNHFILHVCHPRYLYARCCSTNTYMIDSRRVLCSFDFDSAQCFLTSHMESWQRTIAVIQAQRPAKFRRNTNATATESKDDLQRQLLFICARLGLRNVRDVSLLNSICYSTVKLPKDKQCASLRPRLGKHTQLALGEILETERDHLTSMPF